MSKVVDVQVLSDEVLDELNTDVQEELLARKQNRLAKLHELAAALGVKIVSGPGEKAVRKAVAPKYQNDAGQTCTGRGKQPKWLVEAIAKGHDLADFRIVAMDTSDEDDVDFE